MSLEAILLLVILGVVLAIFFLRNRNSSGSDSLLLQLNEALRNEIQEIRKDVAQNAQTSRVEIEGKLKTINQEINEFQKSAKQNMQQQFSQSNKIVKEVTSELEKIKGTNEQVLNFATQMKSLEKTINYYKKKGANFTFHNYFPPPKKPIVLNYLSKKKTNLWALMERG